MCLVLLLVCANGAEGIGEVGPVLWDFLPQGLTPQACIRAIKVAYCPVTANGRPGGAEKASPHCVKEA